MTQDELVKHVLDRIEKIGPSRSSAKFVAISGMDCAGKSTLALALQERLATAGFCVTRISIDRFLIPWEAKTRRAPEFLGYFEDAFDYQALTHELDIARGSSQIVLVEGVFLLRQELRHWWDLAIWLEVDSALALERAVIRDLAYFGDEATVRLVYETRCAPAQSHHLQRDEPWAHAHIVASFRAGFWSAH
jgi:uridine kinase